MDRISTSSAYNLTVSNTTSGQYALKVMTVVAVLLLPVVLVYQGWTYHVFRKRVRVPSQPSPPSAPGAPGATAQTQPQ